MTEVLEAEVVGEERAVARAGQFEGGLLTDELVKQMEHQVQLVKRQRKAVCQLTEPDHWQDIEGKPHLKSGGVHAIAAPLGVEFSKPMLTEERAADEQGDFIRITCQLAASFRGRSLPEQGEASTRDPFFGKSKGKLVPLSEIDLGDVRKKAITNAQGRALTRLLGISGVTWEMLRSIGVVQGAGGTTRYKGSEGKASTGVGEWTQEKAELWGMLKEICGGDEPAAEKLFSLTHNPDKGFQGKRDPAALTSGMVKWLYPRVKAEWDKLFPGGQEEPAPREPGTEG